MKKITTYLKLFAALSLFLSVSTGYSQCPVANFSYINNSSGTATLVSTSTSTNSGMYYSWSSPSGSPTLTAGTNVTQAIVNYTNNGWQGVLLTVTNPVLNCSSTMSINVTFSNIPMPCSLTASFTTSAYYPNSMYFSSAPSTGVANGIATYIWNYGDSTPSGTGYASVHTYTSNGTYTVTLNINNNTSPACAASYSSVVTVTNACSVMSDFTYTLSPSGTVSLTSISTGTNGSSYYAWSVPGASPSSTAGTGLTQASTTYTNNGVYNISLNASNTSPSCSNIAVHGVTVTTLPCTLNAGFSYATNSTPGQVLFTNTSTGIVPALTTYSFNFGDGTGNTWPNGAHIYSTNGTYTVLFTANNNIASSCVSTSSAVVTVTNICSLASNFTYTLNPSGTVSLTSTSTGTSGSTNYSWQFTGGSPSYSSGIGVTQASTTFTNNGIYNLVLSIAQISTCSNTAVQTITITNLPCTLNAGFTSSNGANPGQVIFNSNSTGLAPGLTTYSYNFGDATGTATQSASHVYASNGTYTVTLTVNNHLSPACISTYSAVITVTSACNSVAAFSYGLGANGAVSYSSTSTGTAANTTYYWNFGGGLPSGATGTNLAQPTNTFFFNGTYTAQLYIYTPVGANTCSSSTTRTIIIVNTPTCNLTAGLTYISYGNGNVNFYNSTTGAAPGYSTSLNFGDGSSAVAVSSSSYAAHQYTANGTYTVTLNVNNNFSPACTSSYSAVITVTNVCSMTASFTYSLGSNGAVSYTSTSVGTTTGTIYYWYFTGGVPSSLGATNLSQPTSTFYTTGSHLIQLSLIDPVTSCSSTAVQHLTTTSTPTCNLAASFSFAVSNNGNVGFTNTSTGMSGSPTRVINFGDGSPNSSSFSYASHQYTTNGTYTVVLNVNNNVSPACTSSYSAVVTVTNVCNLSANYTYTLGANGSVNFSSTSTGTNAPGANYSWYFVQGTPVTTVGINLTNVSTTFTNNGGHTVYLDVTSSVPTCSANTAHTINITNVTPTCNVSANFSITQGSSGLVYFANTSTGTGTNSTYYWNFGDASTATLTSPAHTYTANGAYTATMVVTNYTCTSTQTMVVVVNNICNLAAGFTYTTGSNGSVAFSNASTGTNGSTQYAWNFGDGGTNATASPSHNYLLNGTYTVILTVTNPSVSPTCTSTVSQVIVISTSTCVADASFTLVPSGTPQYWHAIPSNTANIANAVWNWGDGSNSPGLYSSHTYSAAGNYSMCLSVTITCGASATSCATYYVSRSADDNSVVYVDVINADQVTTALKNNAADKTVYTVFPNPNNGVFNVSISGINSAKAKINVYNVVGAQVYASESETSNGTLVKDINLDGLSNGVYFIKVNAGNKEYTKKLVINK